MSDFQGIADLLAAGTSLNSFLRDNKIVFGRLIFRRMLNSKVPQLFLASIFAACFHVVTGIFWLNLNTTFGCNFSMSDVT